MQAFSNPLAFYHFKQWACGKPRTSLNVGHDFAPYTLLYYLNWAQIITVNLEANVSSQGDDFCGVPS